MSAIFFDGIRKIEKILRFNMFCKLKTKKNAEKQSA